VFIAGVANVEIDRERIGLAAGFGLGGLVSLVAQVTLRSARLRIAEQTRAAHLRRADLLRGRRELTRANARAEATLLQLQGMEAIGRALAEQGPTPATLDGVMGLLIDTFGYTHPSIYTSHGRMLRLGAQRGYEHPIVEFEPSMGVIGRVARTRQAAFLPDVTMDPDYMSADPAIRSEISIPLLAHDEFLGVLNVESLASLDERDLAAVSVVADRMAAALALANGRANLAERARVFRQVVAFSSKVSSVLAAGELYEVIVHALDAVVPAELVALVVVDKPTGTFVVRAEQGGRGAVGKTIEPGEGMAGRAIRDGTLVRVEDFRRSAFPTTIGPDTALDAYGWALGVPLVGEGGTIGALTVARVDHDRPFTDLDLEALDLLAGEITLAVSNALLHGEVAELAVRDALTGLHNRRFFDEAFRTLTAGRARLPEPERQPLAIVLFDLDHFGAFNKLHGHLVGDEVLRTFGRLLQGRLREADLVCRYGGEEFVAVLPGASRADACRIAEQIRVALETTPIIGAAGVGQSVTVSAGCAEADAAETTPETLIRAADVALSMAKRGGRNRIVAV
jgi:diguanylate cyclase (GGDEF)-like protein